MKCPNCEANVAINEKICPNCGFDFSTPPVTQNDEHLENNNENIDVDINAEKNNGKVDKKSSAYNKKHKLKPKTKVMIALIILLIFLLFGTFIFVSINRSNGKRIYNNLSQKLGNTIAIAEKHAGIELMKNSGYEFIPNIQDFNYIYECPDTVLINGIHVPEWIIFCTESDNGALQQVIYYDFTVMKINANGIKRNDKIDINAVVPLGTSLNEMNIGIQMSPFITINNSNKTTTQIYKYYYMDTDTKDEISYYITIEFDNNDKVISVSEQRDNAIEYIINGSIEKKENDVNQTESSMLDDSSTIDDLEQLESTTDESMSN